MNEQLEQEQQTPQLQPSAVPDTYKDIFINLLKHCEIEDIGVHVALVARCRRLQFLFDNLLDAFWDDVAHDWRIPDPEDLESEDDYVNRVVNYYRPHAESIIAALSVSDPKVVFFPQDADNAEDIDTSENYSNAAKLIAKRNKAPLLFIKVITKLFNAGTVFAYTYYKKDKKFGFYHKEIDNFVDQPYVSYVCEQCGYESEQPEPICPQCGGRLLPQQTTEKVNQPISIELEKGNSFIDIFDPTNVKIPFYARSQEQVGYLLLKFDQSTALLRSIFCSPGPNGELPLTDWIESSNADVNPDSWTRYPTIYRGSQPENTSVVKLAWFKPFQFWAIAGKDAQDREIISEILAKYPKGCYVTFINDKPVEVYEEEMDAVWSISYDPRAQSLHGEAIGTNLAVIHEINTEVDELILQTMEHGISELFVASDIIDWDKYQSSQAKPGSLVPVQKSLGKSISENFYESRTATLSPEIGSIQAKYKDLAEFAVGDFPYVSGATTDVSGETATAFNKSQTQALQRLGTSWKVAAYFWAEVMEKATSQYMEYLEYEDGYSERSSGVFNNVAVSNERNNGKIGRCEPEFSDQLPTSWAQLQQLVTSLMSMKNPIVDSVLTHPQNFEFVKKAVGTNEIYFPGEADRNKQLKEIDLLLQQAPITMPDSPSGFGPSILPEEFDKHEIEMEICAVWLNSSKGQSAKAKNPIGYQNVVMHWKAHQMMLMMSAAPTNEPQNETPNSSKEPVNNA